MKDWTLPRVVPREELRYSSFEQLDPGPAAYKATSECRECDEEVYLLIPVGTSNRALEVRALRCVECGSLLGPRWR